MTGSKVFFLDRVMGKLLFVDVLPQDVDAEQEADTARRAFSFSLVFSGIRCTLQYMIFPFILPLVGITTSVAVPILLVINLLAMVSIFFSLRRFWKIGYDYRWQYLGVALVALLILIVFTLMDFETLMGG